MSGKRGMKGLGGNDTREGAIAHLRARGYTLTEIYSVARPHSWRRPDEADRRADRVTRRGTVGLLWALLALIPGLMLAHGCASLPVLVDRPDWPVRDDGSPYARCEFYKGNLLGCDCATEGPGLTWTIHACPEPEPTPEPTPTPTPAPKPTPIPPPEPTPTPEPGTCGESLRSDYVLTCKWDACDVLTPIDPETGRRENPAGRLEPEHFGATLNEALRIVIAGNPHIVREGRFVAAHEMQGFSERVAEEVKRQGKREVCAKAGCEGKCDTMGEDEVALWRGRERAHFDIGIGPNQAGDFFVGPQVRGFVAVGELRDGATPPGPDPGSGEQAPGELCPGFGDPPDWDWPSKRDANIGATDHWLPLAGPTASKPSQPTEPRPDGLRWLHPRNPAPWYATNPDLSRGSRVRHEDGLEYVRGQGYRHVAFWRYYRSEVGWCPVPGVLHDAAPPVARVRP